MFTLKTWRKLFVFLLLLFCLAGCWNDMENQPYYRPLEASEFFPDQRSARPIVPGTVPHGGEFELNLLTTGRGADGEFSDSFPFPVTMEVLERGQERYDIFCSPCHGWDGYGQGMIVQRGFSPPPSFHIERLRQAPAGHYFDVISNGFGQMYSYADRVKTDDRWAIVAYIRALQLSQNATPQDVPPDQLQQLEQTSQ